MVVLAELAELATGNTILLLEVEKYTMQHGITKLRFISFSYGKTKRFVFLSRIFQVILLFL